MKIFPRICFAVFLSASLARAAGGLVIHEWGTLTSLEDENGRAIAGINADDEPVPSFVHRISPGLLLLPQQWAIASKGVPRVHPDVTVRLETPVLYVHAPPGFTGPLDVKVKYAGGWLTEFYPNAEAVAPGIDPNTRRVGHIAGDGTLDWEGLRIGGNRPGPVTSERVWLAPRNVAADAVSTPGGESEKFLFYRGVGRGEPLLSLCRDHETGVLRSRPNADPASNPAYWLADIRADGTAAFQIVAPFQSSRAFEQEDYGTGNIAALRASLEAELIRSGLYRDEAEALLNTWEVSYFKNPGLRAFYIYPRELVDRLLPLTISPAAEITRVMVGRIELVTADERAAMARMGSADFAESEQSYAGLGRFRDALLLDQERRYPAPGLEQFMRQMNVAYYQP
jgi:hypothetical protein